MSQNIKERIEALRSLMKEKNLDAYLVPTDDFHASEYVGEYFKCRKFITGFTGSAGTAVITMDHAGLWTDGRYFLQAADQLAGTPVTLYKMGEPGVPTVEEYLVSALKSGQTLGFDGRTVSTAAAESLVSKLEKKNVAVSYELDLIGEVWADRPALSCEPAMELGVNWTGKPRMEKCADVRKVMEEQNADVFLLASLDDIAWLLNIRGADVACNPVVLSYLAMTKDEILLFANPKVFAEDMMNSFRQDGIQVLPYDGIYEYAAGIAAGKSVLVCKDKVNYRLFKSIPEAALVLNQPNPTLLPKAIKNPVEVENERIAHIKDGVAVTKWIYWLKQNVGKQKITEISAADELAKLRAQQENAKGLSFSSIIAYGPHGAIVHYSATPETDVEIRPEGLLLADTGGQYLEGTTDITRTIAVGPVTEEEKKCFTAVLRGHLNLANAKFMYGCRGFNLDYIAREPLWKMGMDYNHGTGHGIGYFLNVHEGPNGFRWRMVPGKNESAVFEEGMITSDEPGLYLEGKFGIRHENLIVCKKAEKTEFGQFMCFEYLTMVPFDLEAIAPEQMTEQERVYLNEYHAMVYAAISPYLTEEERQWLAQATRAI